VEGPRTIIASKNDIPYPDFQKPYPSTRISWAGDTFFSLAHFSLSLTLRKISKHNKYIIAIVRILIEITFLKRFQNKKRSLSL